MINNYDPTKNIEKMLSQFTKLSDQVNYFSCVNNLSLNLENITKSLIEKNVYFRDKHLTERIITSRMTDSIDSLMKLTSSMTLNIPTIKVVLDSVQSCLKAIETIQAKYGDFSNISNWDVEDVELMSDCQIELEDISIQQMADVISGEYDEQNPYEEPDLDVFSQKASEIDFVNNSEEAIKKLDEILFEVRQFKDNSKPNEIVRNTFMRNISDVLKAEMILIAFRLLLVFLDHAFADIEIVHDFLCKLIDLL